VGGQGTYYEANSCVDALDALGSSLIVYDQPSAHIFSSSFVLRPFLFQKYIYGFLFFTKTIQIL